MKSWVYLILALLIAMGTATFDAKALDLTSPVCPSNLYVGQRYDTWRYVNGRTQIVESRYIRKCYEAPRIIWKKATLN